QVGAIPVARGDRPTRCFARVRIEPGGRCRGSGVGQHGGDPVPGPAGASGRFRKAHGRGTGCAGQPGFDDRYGQGREYAGSQAMNGVHDMGGMHGMGPIRREANEPVFHERWEARVYALNRAIGAWGKWNIDAGRHAIERLAPADYLRMSYYEKWLTRNIE